jgi:hypothetical protein
MASVTMVPQRQISGFPGEIGPGIDITAAILDTRQRGPVTVLRFPSVSQPTPPPQRAPAGGPGYAPIAASVAVAVNSLEALSRSLLETAESFRDGLVHGANIELVRVATGLHLLTTLADASASAAGLDLSALGSSGRLDAMGQALDELTSFQFAEDWPGVAETLEHRILPALSGWREVFTEILVHADGRFRQPHAS